MMPVSLPTLRLSNNLRGRLSTRRSGTRYSLFLSSLMWDVQEWHDGVEYAGKRVLLIGSGATAVTLAPALAHHAEEVAMLELCPLAPPLSGSGHDASAVSWVHCACGKARFGQLRPLSCILIGALIVSV